MTREELITLCDRIVTGRASKEDMDTYNALWERYAGEGWGEAGMGDRGEIRQMMKRTIQAAIRPAVVVTQVRWRPWSAAAAVVLMLGAGGWWWSQTRSRSSSVPPAVAKIDVPAPQSNRATITLGNGRQVFLDSVGSGALAVQGNVRIVKLPDGQVAYQPTRVASGEISFNTLTNPRGSRVVTVTLSDGTKVWLNAGTTLRYPAAFSGGERTVQIDGEAYFEVSSDMHRPFGVVKGNTKVLVLGTAFDINAYGDEPALRVTLLAGKVQVEKENSKLVLRPGEQAVVTGTIERQDGLDTSVVMAWKNGLFAFAGSDLETVMRQLSRWYDVDVRYEGAIPPRRFGGKLDRSATLDQVLKTLASTRVHYTIEDKHHLTIRP
ncbi:MAG TPA: FecR domain-containing protein [Puia sp.]|nr:FecR domain-containing protein [Puia sp.]